MKKLLTILLCLPLLFTACKKEDDNNSPQSTQSPFTGSWSGSFQGNDSYGNVDYGNWSGNISSSGVLNGEGWSYAEGDLVGTGNVTNSGTLNASFTSGITSTGATFTGTLIVVTAWGEWENLDYGFSGLWHGKKD